MKETPCAAMKESIAAAGPTYHDERKAEFRASVEEDYFRGLFRHWTIRSVYARNMEEDAIHYFIPPGAKNALIVVKGNHQWGKAATKESIGWHGLYDLLGGMFKCILALAHAVMGMLSICARLIVMTGTCNEDTVHNLTGEETEVTHPARKVDPAGNGLRSESDDGGSADVPSDAATRDLPSSFLSMSSTSASSVTLRAPCCTSPPSQQDADSNSAAITPDMKVNNAAIIPGMKLRNIRNNQQAPSFSALCEQIPELKDLFDGGFEKEYEELSLQLKSDFSRFVRLAMKKRRALVDEGKSDSAEEVFDKILGMLYFLREAERPREIKIAGNGQCAVPDIEDIVVKTDVRQHLEQRRMVGTGLPCASLSDSVKSVVDSNVADFLAPSPW